MIGDLSNELNPLCVGSVVDTSLKDTATVSMSGNFNTMSSDCVVDELINERRR